MRRCKWHEEWSEKWKYGWFHVFAGLSERPLAVVERDDGRVEVIDRLDQREFTLGSEDKFSEEFTEDK